MDPYGRCEIEMYRPRNCIVSLAVWVPCVLKMKQYLFGMVYSPGEGPVLFTHSAEAYPLYIRDLGMPLATATTWFFNGALSITWPSLLRAFKPQGAFSYCAVWNIIG